MEDDQPYRTPSGPKPEKIIQFIDSSNVEGEIVESAIAKANKWLSANVGKVEIILREVAVDNTNYFPAILIWYQEK